MNQTELDAIEARAQAATPGPWDSAPQYINSAGLGIAKVNACRVFKAGYYGPINPDKADAQFIAAARTDIPNLIAEIRLLQDEVEKQRRHPSNSNRIQPDQIAPHLWREYLETREEHLLANAQPDDLREVVPLAAVEIARLQEQARDTQRHLEAARAASVELWASLIGVEGSLRVPYPERPEWSPWTRFVERPLKEFGLAMDAAQAHLKELRGNE